MIKGVGHIGIAVKDIDQSLRAASRALGVPLPPVRNNTEKKMRFAVLELGNVSLEFIEDYSDDGVFARFVKERGDAIHHFCLLTDDLDSDAADLKSRGIDMWIETPTVGLRGKRIVFTQPNALNGIPFELSEP
jgi:methylmalonyl-CoA/ethylmalonyl-CoA epimerase